MTDTPTIERRAFEMEELRVEGNDGEAPRITGHAAVFDKLSQDLGGFREKIAPGAFRSSIKGDVRALFNHNPDFILGRTKAGTLALEEDRKGLSVDITPPDTDMGRSVVEAVRRGDISQMSFGFRTIKDEWHTDQAGKTVRTLHEVELFDVSPVPFAAYPQTDVSVAKRSLDAWRAAEENDGDGGTDPGLGDDARDALALMAARTRQAFVP